MHFVDVAICKLDFAIYLLERSTVWHSVYRMFYI